MANDIFVNKFSVPKRQLHVLYYRGVDLRNGLTSTLKTAHDHGSKVKFLFVFVDPLFWWVLHLLTLSLSQNRKMFKGSLMMTIISLYIRTRCHGPHPLNDGFLNSRQNKFGNDSIPNNKSKLLLTWVADSKILLEDGWGRWCQQKRLLASRL